MIVRVATAAFRKSIGAFRNGPKCSSTSFHIHKRRASEFNISYFPSVRIFHPRRSLRTIKLRLQKVLKSPFSQLLNPPLRLVLFLFFSFIYINNFVWNNRLLNNIKFNKKGPLNPHLNSPLRFIHLSEQKEQKKVKRRQFKKFYVSHNFWQAYSFWLIGQVWKKNEETIEQKIEDSFFPS